MPFTLIGMYIDLMYSGANLAQEKGAHCICDALFPLSRNGWLDCPLRPTLRCHGKCYWGDRWELSEVPSTIHYPHSERSPEWVWKKPIGGSKSADHRFPWSLQEVSIQMHPGRACLWAHQLIPMWGEAVVNRHACRRLTTTSTSWISPTLCWWQAKTQLWRHSSKLPPNCGTENT